MNHRRLLPILLMLTVTLLPIQAAFADDATTPLTGEGAVAMVQEPTSDEVRFVAAQDHQCAGVVQIDTSGSVAGRQPMTGWAIDANEGGLTAGVDLIEIYRGSVRVAGDAIGVSRPDVDTYWGRSDMRAGYAIEIDWLTQPGGQQTYTIRARTACDWVGADVTLDVNPTPPAPPVALSIGDERRSVSNSYNSGSFGSSCVSRDIQGNCTSYGGGSGYGQTCMSRDIQGNCTSYGGGSSYGQNCVSRDIYGNCASSGSGSSSFGQTCVSRDGYGNCLSYGSNSGTNSNYTSGCIYGTCNSSATMGNMGQSETNFDFTVSLSPASSQTVTVNYATADGSAAAGSDYTSTNGTLTFSAGETSKSITVRVHARDYGDNRTFYVRLSNPSNASIADGEGTGTVERRYSSSSSDNYGMGNQNCMSRDIYGNCSPNASTGQGVCSPGYSWDGYACRQSGGTNQGYQVTITPSTGATLTWQQTPNATSYQIWHGSSGACSSFTPISSMLPTTPSHTLNLSGTQCLEVRDQSGQRAYITSATER